MECYVEWTNVSLFRAIVSFPQRQEVHEITALMIMHCRPEESVYSCSWHCVLLMET